MLSNWVGIVSGSVVVVSNTSKLTFFMRSKLVLRGSLADGTVISRLPENPEVNEALAQFNNVQVAMFQFPRLPLLQWMFELLLFRFHISESGV
jgi:hypothetical protein